MRIFTILFCLLAFLNAASAQAPAKPVKNPSELAKWELYDTKYDHPAYVIDETPIADFESKRIVGGLDPYAILKTTIVQTGTLKTRYVVYITTNLKKITEYQKKFGAFSSDYRNYLAAHQNRDAHFSYYVDGVLIQGFRPDVTDRLCAIPAEKIKEVRFKPDNTATEGRQMVSITTNIITAKTTASPPNTISSSTLVILNGTPYNKKLLNKINPNDIEDVSVVKPETAKQLYGAQGENGALLITTKQYVISTFKKRLALFSNKYKEYITSNPDSHHITYVLNGSVLNRNPLGVANVLYNIPVTQLKDLSFKLQRDSTGSNEAMVNITINQ